MTTEQLKPYRKLTTSKHLKRLITRSFMEVRYFRLGRPLAWVTSGAPVELIRACGFLTVYPENYGAICGASKVGPELCQRAEAEGFSLDICSYARVNLGSLYQPEQAPGGGLPKPDCVIAATNLCNTLVKWFEQVADYYQVPLYVLDIPFQYELKSAVHDAVYIRKQFDDMIEFLTGISNRNFSVRKFRKILSNSMEAIRLWQLIRETGKSYPSPINAPDLFLNLAPIVSLRGSRGTIRFYRKLHRELESRMDQGIGAVREERYRLLWDNIAIWYNLFDLFNFFSQQGVCFVVSTYTDAWSAHWDPAEDPVTVTARMYRDAYLNLSLQKRIEMMCESVTQYGVDGIVMHSNRSCKPYSLGQVEILRRVSERTGVPGILIESDMVDSRFYTDAQVKNRLLAFLEILTARASS